MKNEQLNEFRKEPSSYPELTGVRLPYGRRS